MLAVATVATSRTPPGVRELKLDELELEADGTRRTPPGVRELKLNTVI